MALDYIVHVERNRYLHQPNFPVVVECYHVRQFRRKLRHSVVRIAVTSQ